MVKIEQPNTIMWKPPYVDEHFLFLVFTYNSDYVLCEVRPEFD